MNRRIPIFIILALLTAAVTVDQQACFGQTVAYTDVTIETAGQAGRIEKGVLLVQDGKIVEVGEDVTIPDDARIQNLAGMTLMPTIIDPYFVFQQGDDGGATRTITFNGRTITIPNRGGDSSPGPFVEIAKYFYPYEFDFRPAARSGIGIANLVADGQGLSALAHLKLPADPEMIFQPSGFVFARVSNQTSSLDLIRRPLRPSQRGNARGGRPGSARGGSNTNSSSQNDEKESSDKSESEESSDPWDVVKEGKKPLFVNASNSATIAHVLQFLKDQEKVNLVLVASGENLFELVGTLKQQENVSVVLEPGLDRVPYSNDWVNVPRMLQENGVPFAISLSLSRSQLEASQDDPLFPLALLVKTGLDRHRALGAVTIEPAKMLGIEKEYGTLEKGKQASFLMFEGDPLETGSCLKQVVLNGVTVHEN